MTTKAGAGHFGPLIPFARAFQRAGADVLIAAPREAAPMVRAEGLPLWAFDDPPARGARRDLRRGARPAHRRPASTGASSATSSRASTRAPRFPGVLAACRAWGPDVVISEITEFAGPLAAEVVGVPSVCVGISQQGKEERVIPVVVARSTSCAAHFGLAPDPGGERLLRRPYFTLIPAALEDPATPARARVAPLPRGAPGRAPARGLRRARRTSARSST